MYFCMFVDEFLNSNEKKETLARWSYEIYSTFLMTNAVSAFLCFEQGHPLKSSSLEFDRIFDFNRFLPETYHFVEKS